MNEEKLDKVIEAQEECLEKITDLKETFEREVASCLATIKTTRLEGKKESYK